MKYLFFLVIFCLWFFLITVIHITISRTGRSITHLQNEVAIKEARNQYIKLEIARLSGPETVLSFAQNNLGMVSIKPHEIILLDHIHK